jgi:hypothetical protein
MSEQGPSTAVAAFENIMCFCAHPLSAHFDVEYDCSRCACSGIGLPGMIMYEDVPGSTDPRYPVPGYGTAKPYVCSQEPHPGVEFYGTDGGCAECDYRPATKPREVKITHEG